MTNAPLISRLVEAKEGSRELSDKVLRAVGFSEDRDRNGNYYWSHGARKYYYEERPDPTRSLDDAVDLVPEKWGWSIEGTGGGLIYRKEKIRGEHGHPILAEIDGGRPPPIGMCILLLKAMETEGG